VFLTIEILFLPYRTKTFIIWTF